MWQVIPVAISAVLLLLLLRGISRHAARHRPLPPVPPHQPLPSRQPKSQPIRFTLNWPGVHICPRCNPSGLRPSYSGRYRCGTCGHVFWTSGWAR